MRSTDPKAELIVKDDECKACGSSDLWSAYFNKQGYAVSGATGDSKYRTLCNACGQFQDRPIRKAKRTRKA